VHTTPLLYTNLHLYVSYTHTLTSSLLTIFFFNDTPTTETYTLSLHDALPILAAERRLDAARHPLVHVDLPGLEPRRHAVRAGEVAGPDAGGESVLGVVGDADRLLLVVEGDQDRKSVV